MSKIEDKVSELINSGESLTDAIAKASIEESLIEVETKICVETCGTYSNGVITILSEEESAEIAKISVSYIFDMMRLDTSKKYEFKIEVEECD